MRCSYFIRSNVVVRFAIHLTSPKLTFCSLKNFFPIRFLGEMNVFQAVFSGALGTLQRTPGLLGCSGASEKDFNSLLSSMRAGFLSNFFM